jgi:hypothetical protein
MKRTLSYMLFLLFVILLHVVFSSAQVAGAAKPTPAPMAIR